MLSRSSAEAIGDVILMGFAAGITLLSGLAIVGGLPLLLVAAGASGWPGGWWNGLWFPAAWFVAFYNIVTALEVMKTATPEGAAKLVAASALITLTCPL